MAKYTLEEVHHLLLIEAAERANQEFAQKAANLDIPVSGEIFRPDPLASDKGGLCLTIEPLIAAALTDEQLDVAWEIGKDAIYDTLIARKQQFIGAVLGEAREGRSYFDRFQ